jgi:hypothetical protein
MKKQKRKKSEKQEKIDKLYKELRKQFFEIHSIRMGSKGSLT